MCRAEWSHRRPGKETPACGQTRKRLLSSWREERPAGLLGCGKEAGSDQPDCDHSPQEGLGALNLSLRSCGISNSPYFEEIFCAQARRRSLLLGQEREGVWGPEWSGQDPEVLHGESASPLLLDSSSKKEA